MHFHHVFIQNFIIIHHKKKCAFGIESEHFFSQDNSTWKEGAFPFHEYIPYEHYHEEYDLYGHNNVVGWVCELSPYPNVPETLEKDLQALLDEILPEESSLQIILFSDPYTHCIFHEWKHAKKYDNNLLNLMSKKNAWNSYLLGLRLVTFAALFP